MVQQLVSLTALVFRTTVKHRIFGGLIKICDLIWLRFEISGFEELRRLEIGFCLVFMIFSLDLIIDFC